MPCRAGWPRCWTRSRGPRLTKDVWVPSEDSQDIVGPPVRLAPPLRLRRASGDLPSRVADNLFWLGRYVERLDRAARLVRAALVRLSRGAAMLPREGFELQVLARCLAEAGVIEPESTHSAPDMTLGAALRESLREKGAVHDLFAQVAGLTGSVRDRLTGDMHATFTHMLRVACDEATLAARDGDLDRLTQAMVGISRFSTAVAGVAAENMVRGGGWLFLDLGRRLERAQAVTTEVGFSIDQPAARMEAGLRLALELCDSSITYRSRYFNVLQAAPVLDLVLADQGNPRGLAFQLVVMHESLDALGGGEGGGAGADGEAGRERLAGTATWPWEQVAAAAQAGGPDGWEAAEFAFDSPMAPADAGAGAYTAASFPPGRPVLAGLLELTGRIRREFTFKPGVTTINTPVARVLAQRAGVCQDFTHLMIAGLRALGLPARYVSGYLRTRPPPRQQPRQGADQSHAWVGAWLGPAHGWVDLDPTNDLVVHDEHVVLAWGRDYGDTSPVRGIILGGGSHTVTVAVDLAPVEGTGTWQDQ